MKPSIQWALDRMAKQVAIYQPAKKPNPAKGQLKLKPIKK